MGFTPEGWRRRQAQWARFHAWEQREGRVSLTVSERVAAIGVLADWVLKRSPPSGAPSPAVAAQVAGIIQMRRWLAVLGQAA